MGVVILLLGTMSIVTTPTDIFPDIDKVIMRMLLVAMMPGGSPLAADDAGTTVWRVQSARSQERKRRLTPQ
jgi:hypothetical protein